MLLLVSEPWLHAYAPTCMALSDPPNEFAPSESLESPELVKLEATQFEQDAFEMITVKPCAAATAHVLLLL